MGSGIIGKRIVYGYVCFAKLDVYRRRMGYQLRHCDDRNDDRAGHFVQRGLERYSYSTDCERRRFLLLQHKCVFLLGHVYRNLRHLP